MSRASELGSFADKDPGNSLLLCDLLDELLAEGRAAEAMMRLQGARPDLRGLKGVQFREARCALLMQDFARVVAILQPLMDGQSPAPAGIVHDLAYAQFSLGRLDDALQTLAFAPARDDDAVAIVLLQARIFYQQKQYDAALAVLEPVTSGARLAEVRGLRAMLLLDTGQTARAAEQAELALADDASQHEAAIVRATVALWERQIDLSLATFEHVLAAQPRSGRALLGLGQNWMLRGDVATARAALERAAREMPEHIGTWHALAWCQLMQGDLAGAKRSFDRAFAIDRTFGETHGGFALVHALRGERAEAEESIKRAMRLDPDGSSARYAKSVLLLDDGRVKDADKIIRGILTRSPDQAVAMPADFIFRLRELVRPRG